MPASTERPYPPLDLASRVFTVTGWDSDPYRAYEEIGAQTSRALVGLLPDDWSFDGKRALDFGRRRSHPAALLDRGGSG